jgi:hypothetical protein
MRPLSAPTRPATARGGPHRTCGVVGVSLAPVGAQQARVCNLLHVKGQRQRHHVRWQAINHRPSLQTAHRLVNQRAAAGC